MARNKFGFEVLMRKSILDQNRANMSEADVERKEKEIELFEFLAERNRGQDDIYTLMNSGFFNDIVRGYFKIAFEEMEDCADTRKAEAAKLIGGDIIYSLDRIFDFCGADIAEQRYLGQ